MSATIRLKGCGRYEEAVAAAAITPGQLIKQDNTGKVLRHATAGANTGRWFALEDSLQGKTIDDDYAADDIVGYSIAAPGDEINAILDAGENVVRGDKLESAGNGNLQKLTSGTAVAEAMAALDLSQSGDVASRLHVRVL